jgi:hypothetical protein
MSFLSFRRFTGTIEDTNVHIEELSFHGASLDEADTEMRQWISHTMPLGPCEISIVTGCSTEGTQYTIFLHYTCRQNPADRIEPNGIFGFAELS